MMNPHQISRETDHVERDRRLQTVYGHIVEMLNLDDQDFYMPLVVLEQSSFAPGSSLNYIPLDDTPEQLAANYGAPRDLIGLRVRIEYFGNSWRTGVAKVVSGRSRQPVGNLTEVPSRGFRYAVAGGGGLL
jgi:hypothetical protein